ncbi:hypothetical protein Dsin_005825 [Dipteronia sinensis]|uniref:Putative plant transposon protein domain-containing protein n=1 Tax=Dipteronia sinensis TaxID=43782 RepID=A0AAE0AY14_9ROSI|nr:hypothetical protein Dsin_005825 [Dipteronia sinensis]
MRRPPPPPVEDPSDASRRKGKEPMERPVQRHPEFTCRLKSNQRRSMVVERGLNSKDLEGTRFLIDVDRLRWRTYCTIRNQCNKTMVQEFYAAMCWQHFLEGGSMRVRGKNVNFNAKNINEWWETQSYPQWTEGYEYKGIYQLYIKTLANELQDTEYGIWNTSNMFIQGQIDFKSAFWHTFFSYSLFPSHHRHNVTLRPAILLYLMKKNLPFDCGTIALKRIAEAGRTNVPSLAFPCLITHFCDKSRVRLQKEMRAERRAAVEVGVDEQVVEEGFQLGAEPSTHRERRAPRRSAELMPDWAQDLTTMVRDLSIEFKALKDSFGDDGTYIRRTPQFSRKRTNIEGPSSRANGADCPELELAISPMHAPYSPMPDPTFDQVAEF